jgi:hypothetical protein
MTASAKGHCSGKTMNASAKSGTCSKEECVEWLMASKNMTKAEAEKAYANCSKSKSAAIKGVSFANATEKSGSCTKSACVNWLMANKGMTKTEAEAAYQHCEKSKAAAEAGVKLASEESESVTSPAGSSN